MRNINKLLLMFSLTLLFINNIEAQIRYTVGSSFSEGGNDGFRLGEDTYTPLYIGGNNGWSLEQYEGGFNIFRAYPYTGWGNYKLYVDTTGYIGIGRKPVSYKLEVAGNIGVSGVYRTTSDIRLKSEIQDLNQRECLFSLKLIDGKIYQKRKLEEISVSQEIEHMIAVGKLRKFDDLKNLISSRRDSILSKYEYGFIAQDFRKIYPDLVFEDKNGYLSIDYQGLIPIVIEAIKELNNVVKTQNETIKHLMEELEFGKYD